MEKIIVTRHPALVAYLYEIGLVGETDIVTVIDHATGWDIKGKHVIGCLPNSLACEALSVTEVPLFIPANMLGKELTLDQIRENAGLPETFKVTLC